jgi:uncharacterized protein YheU (UPF0270 family)
VRENQIERVKQMIKEGKIIILWVGRNTSVLVHSEKHESLVNLKAAIGISQQSKKFEIFLKPLHFLIR